MKKTIIALLALAGAAAGESITLSIPLGIQNSGSGYIDVQGAITVFANGEDGGYMFNSGGAVGPNTATQEGEIRFDEVNGTCLTLQGRTGAGGSGEAIVLSATNLNGYLVDSFAFSIAGSSCDQSGKEVGMTLAVIQKAEEGTTWSLVGEAAEDSFLTGSGGSVKLTLTDAITWSDSYKVVAIVDNLDKQVDGGSTVYTMTGISVSATYSIPEPATATLSLLALAGLAVRRRR